MSSSKGKRATKNEKEKASRKECMSIATKLRKDSLREFLRKHNMYITGTKAVLLSRVKEVIDRSQDLNKLRDKLMHRMMDANFHRYTRRSRESFLWNEMIPGLGLGSVDIPAIPLPTMEEKVPHCKTTVTFVQSVFHSLEEHIISPELLVGINLGNIFQMYAKYTVSLTEAQRHLLKDGEHKILLRICKLNKVEQQKESYPYELRVLINGFPIAIPGYSAELCKYPEYQFVATPIDITSKLGSTSSDDNLEIKWCRGSSDFVMTVDLVKITSMDVLVEKLKACIWEEDKTKAFIHEKLDYASANEVVAVTTDTLTVSLHCPLGKMRMSLPVRGSKCTHLQCFDGLLYLQMNSRRESWKCPVCDNVVPFETLVVDKFIQNILGSAESAETSSISFSKDGSWVPCISKPTDISQLEYLSTPQKCDGNVEGSNLEVIDLTLSPTPSTASTATISSPIPSPLSDTNDIVIII